MRGLVIPEAPRFSVPALLETPPAESVMETFSLTSLGEKTSGQSFTVYLTDTAQAARVLAAQVVADGGARVLTARSEPEAWLRALCTHFTGSYLRATEAEEV